MQTMQNMQNVQINKPAELTHRDLQIIATALKERLSLLEYFVNDAKEDIQHYFKESDPDDSSTEFAFEMLNTRKDDLRYNKKRKNKLAEVQRKIKRLLSQG